MVKYEVRFLYDKAALLLYSEEKKYLVLGDIHIGLEKKLHDKGVRLYGNAERMAKQIVQLVRENEASGVILLGDIKESILYPDTTERAEILEFFDILKGIDLEIVVGNHDGHLDEIVKMPIEKELVVGNVAMLHGHMWPSEEAMSKEYLIVAHNHVAVSIKDEKGAIYNEKAWILASLNEKGARERYKNANKRIKLIVMPAFNELITGKPVGMLDERHINPLFRNGIFDYENANVYSISGSILGTPKTLSR
ncbi:MAG TPA: metallophosphoesterase [Candidatus Acidoferrum sp.]|nr:metallophosphoesterase [Candidatus Acidoferrum sp.]